MQFLIDEDLPRSTADLVMKHGYKAIDIRDIGLRGAKDSKIISYAKERNLCLITGDYDFGDRTRTHQNPKVMIPAGSFVLGGGLHRSPVPPHSEIGIPLSQPLAL